MSKHLDYLEAYINANKEDPYAREALYHARQELNDALQGLVKLASELLNNSGGALEHKEHLAKLEKFESKACKYALERLEEQE